MVASRNTFHPFRSPFPNRCPNDEDDSLLEVDCSSVWIVFASVMDMFVDFVLFLICLLVFALFGFCFCEKVESDLAVTTNDYGYYC